MGLFKMTWFFEGLQPATLGAGAAVGWTETWGLNSPSDNIDDTFTNPDVLMYTNLRQQCLSVQYRMSFLRAVTIPQAGAIPTRRVKIQSLPNINGAASLLGQGGAQVQCCVLADLQKLPVGLNDRVHHRKFLIRGLSPDVINGNVINTAGPNWPRIVTFLNFIGQHATGSPFVPGGATMLGVIYQDPNFGKIPMPPITVGAATPRLISFPGLIAFLPGEQIRIGGFSGINGVQWNRVWNFISQAVVGPDTINTFGKSRFDMEVQVGPFPNPATYQRLRPIVGPFSQYAIVGLRSKRTGKVFHQLRGRASRKVRP